MSLVRCAERLVRRRSQFARACEAVLRAFGHSARDHRVERGGDIGPQLAGTRDGRHQMRGDQHAGAVRPIWRGSGQALMEHAGQRIDVGTLIHFGVGKPLRGHVPPGPHRAADLRQFLVGRRTGDPEVHQVNEVILGHQDVFRFHIPMHHAGRVGGVQCGGDLMHQRHRPRGCHRTEPFQQQRQVGALDEAHVQVELPVDFTVIVNGHHVRLLQPARVAGLTLHPHAKHGIVAERLRHQLQCHHALSHGVHGLVDLAHAAGAKLSLEVVGPEAGTYSRASRGGAHRLLLKPAGNRTGKPHSPADLPTAYPVLATMTVIAHHCGRTKTAASVL